MRSRLVAFVLAAAIAVGLAAPPAGAVTAVAAAVEGTGTFDPGIWITSPVQSVTVGFNAEGVFEPGAVVAVESCSFSGTEVNSQADFSGGCSGGVSLNCSFHSVRTVLVWTWRGSCSMNGGSPVAMAADLVIVPTSVNPIRSFAVVGDLYSQSAST
jgi:hypothetical protein